MQKPLNNKTRTLVILMVFVVFCGIGIAWFYYSRVNRSVDPRVKDARKLYQKYNEFAGRSQYDSVLWLMDTIESLYSRIDHYREAYETAVLYNNRAAVYLSVYLQPDNDLLIGDTAVLMQKAENAVIKSIDIIQNWSENYENLNENEIRNKIERDFLAGLTEFGQDEKQMFLDKRIEEILEARTENLRRLSVSYTNLGIIKRHQQKYDSAAFFYKKAIELWDRNLTAENNLNILLNRPMKKRNIIQKLFPPDK